jgi:hypothetical protein
MEDSIISCLALLNILFLGFGYSFVNRRCEETHHEVMLYKDMTQMEITLLNKKLEKKNG